MSFALEQLKGVIEGRNTPPLTDGNVRVHPRYMLIDRVDDVIIARYRPASHIRNFNIISLVASFVIYFLIWFLVYQVDFLTLTIPRLFASNFNAFFTGINLFLWSTIFLMLIYAAFRFLWFRLSIFTALFGRTIYISKDRIEFMAEFSGKNDHVSVQRTEMSRFQSRPIREKRLVDHGYTDALSVQFGDYQLYLKDAIFPELHMENVLFQLNQALEQLQEAAYARGTEGHTLRF